MSEFDLGRLEEKTLAQVRPLNQSLERAFGGRVPPIAESSIHWISEARAEEIKAESHGTGFSPAFAWKGQIYLVSERIAARAQETKDFPFPFNDPLIKAIFTLAHEDLHNACKKFEDGSTTRTVALTCWEALYGDITESVDSEVPEETKAEYRKVNEALQTAGAKVKVRVEGAEIVLGTEDMPFYGFGEQTNEDIIDFMAAITMVDFIKHTIKLRRGEEDNVLKTSLILNANNRQSFEPGDIKALYASLKDFMSPGRQQRVYDSFFSGRLYEEFVPSLGKEERTYFCCHLVLGSTADALPILQGRGIRKKVNQS